MLKESCVNRQQVQAFAEQLSMPLFPTQDNSCGTCCAGGRPDMGDSSGIDASKYPGAELADTSDMAYHQFAQVHFCEFTQPQNYAF